MKYKRPLAIAGIVLIVICYLCTIFFALMDSPNSQNMLMASLFCTIVIPVVLYAYQMILNVMKNKKTDDEE